MNVKRYFARTAREAMARVRAELGEDAIVLKNRPVDGGVEILALAGAELEASSERASAAPARETPAAVPNGRGAPAAPAMSTVHFENYVRERQQRRLADEQEARADSAGRVASSQAPASLAPSWDAFDAPATPAARPDPAPVPEPSPRPGRANATPARERSAPEAPAAHALAPQPLDARDDRIDAQLLMAELREMRGALSDQLESLSWFEGVRRRPGQSRMLRRLLQAGFSPSLARTLANHLPADFGEDDAERWMREALVRNLRIDSPEQTIFDSGGTYALLGPTGVGKTTTAAKIAAQFALKHGAQSVGLITADVYRIGAQDQLRTFGRLLGVPVHVAHDVSTLADFLQMYMNRKLVLIDTAGVAQRDERVGELLAALSSAQVRKVLVLNAASQAEAIDETIEAYQGRNAAGVVLSKVDEAVRLGGALDCLIRHRLTLQGVANGQRVPEDWHRPEPRMLVDRALSGGASQACASFAFEEAELAMLLAAGQRTIAQRAREARRV